MEWNEIAYRVLNSQKYRQVKKAPVSMNPTRARLPRDNNCVKYGREVYFLLILSMKYGYVSLLK